MIFTQTPLAGAYLIDPELLEDERGLFARSWCRREFEAQGLTPHLAQCNISLSHKKGTLRGMHYQCPPHEEVKLVRCTRGAIYDVALDLRPSSPTYKHWYAAELTADNHRMFYIPEGFAHGFVTLEDETEVFYQMSQFYSPEHARGVRWDDPAFNIQWPDGDKIIAPKDRNWPDFSDDTR